jgi:hypothetical protein
VRTPTDGNAARHGKRVGVHGNDHRSAGGRIDARADRAQRRPERARLSDQPVVRVPARAVKRTFSRCTPADRSRSTIVLVSPHLRCRDQIFGPQLDEIVEKGEEVGAAERISATDQEGAGPADGGARAEDVIPKLMLGCRRTARPGSHAGPRTSETRRLMPRIEAPGTGPRARASLDGVRSWRVVFT